ncbi:2-oxoglutarate and iron-dependent oxygenase domain-containing protein 3 [Phytophthora nicotianae]|uniref:histone acetyltransferase n=1 Tax=Phytophthora nicotianae TaxID=4792 RepID=A0A0W8DG83_PHYNI|nr:2-oxoglutarate and iron-dependent oxygenase domain-containing protein 3 [Phytophthora nicotianae]
MAPTETAGIKRPVDEAQTPAVKRVRFANSVSSNDAISLAIATDADEVEAQKLEWFPQNSRITHGYEGLKIAATFNGFDFRALLDVEFKEKDDTADDIVAKLTPSLPEGFVKEKDEFVAALRKAAASFTGPPGKCIESYSMKTSASKGEDSAHDRHFEIYECKLEDNEPAQKLLANLQTLSLWFIEGIDSTLPLHEVENEDQDDDEDEAFNSIVKPAISDVLERVLNPPTIGFMSPTHRDAAEAATEVQEDLLFELLHVFDNVSQQKGLLRQVLRSLADYTNAVMPPANANVTGNSS